MFSVKCMKKRTTPKTHMHHDLILDNPVNQVQIKVAFSFVLPYVGTLNRTVTHIRYINIYGLLKKCVWPLSSILLSVTH